jgi:hypothetical protein
MEKGWFMITMLKIIKIFFSLMILIMPCIIFISLWIGFTKGSQASAVMLLISAVIIAIIHAAENL